MIRSSRRSTLHATAAASLLASIFAAAGCDGPQTAQPAAVPPKAVAASAPAPVTSAPASAQAPDFQVRNAALAKKHDEVWELMGLSPSARTELNGVVLSVNGQIHKNRAEHAEAFQAASAVKRSEKPPTREEFIARHKKRLDMLGISAPTQKELMDAAEFVFAALHDPNVPAEKKKTAQIIKDMMTAMQGPPPCCDENIFERAKP